MAKKRSSPKSELVTQTVRFRAIEVPPEEFETCRPGDTALKEFKDQLDLLETSGCQVSREHLQKLAESAFTIAIVAAGVTRERGKRLAEKLVDAGVAAEDRESDPWHEVLRAIQAGIDRAVEGTKKT